MWELGWNTPIKEADLWEMVCREFCIDNIYMSPVSGIKHKFIKEVSSIKDFLDETQIQAVFLDEKGEIPLHEFKHPESCIYVFGKTNESVLYHKRPGDVSVYIQTIRSSAMLWAHQIAAITFYDRQVKSW